MSTAIQVRSTTTDPQGITQVIAEAAKLLTGGLRTTEEAKFVLEACKAGYADTEKRFWQLGVMVREALKQGAPELLDMNAGEFMELCSANSRSKVYRSIRIVAALEKMDKDKIEKLTEGKAYDLTRLPENVRYSDEWFKKAETLSNTDLAMEVDVFLGKKGLAGDGKPVYVPMFPKMQDGMAVLFTETEIKLARILELDLDKISDRVKLWECVIVLLFNTPDRDLQIAFAGDDGSAPPPEEPHV